MSIPASRYLKLVAAGALGAGLVIWLVVRLTPLEEPSTPEASSLTADEVSRNGDASNAANEPAMLREGGAASRPLIPLEFPEEPEKIVVDKLQAELRNLALMLQQQYPQEAKAFHFSAQIQAELNQTQSAEQLWQKCLALQPTAAGPYVGLAELLIDSGREQQAIAILKQALAADLASAELSQQLGLAYENLGQLDEAHRILQLATAEYVNAPEIWLAAGRVSSQLGEYELAEAQLRRAADGRSTAETARIALTTTLMRQGKTEQAQQIREQLEEIKGRSSASAPGFQENYEAALRGIAQSIYLAVGSMVLEKGQPAEAIRYMKRALQLDPQAAETYMALSSVYRLLDDWPTVLRIHEHLVALQPDHVRNYTNLASVALQIGDPQLAERTLKEAIRLDPQGVLAQESLARLNIMLGKFTEAKLLAAEVLQRSRSVNSYLLLASAYRAAGEEESARQAIQSARELDPQDPRLDAFLRAEEGSR